ncbi:MAG: fatty acid desaturase [Acidimicrobiia bacterium]|nr:fatty acid desaturase [Acidimicrobiia bacterium]
MERRRIEWPTVGVAVAIAAGFAAVLAAHRSLPLPVELVVLALLGAWYNSLQHEVIHGHPTRWARVNTAFGIAPLGLVVPFASYRESHLAHHRDEHLTLPGTDPESFYLAPETWQRYGRVRGVIPRAMRTLAGRLVVGPLVAAVRCWSQGVASLQTRRGAARLAGHVIGVAAVVTVVRTSGLPVWVYVVGVAWGGGALSLLRSFAEHRVVEHGTQSAVVAAGPLMSLLYLNNNLHHTHHAMPWVPWYELPGLHTELDADRLAAEGAGRYDGYGDIARRYLLRPFGTVAHPSAPLTPAAAPAATDTGLAGAEVREAAAG